ncbi:MAG TPA: YndJ family protein [Dactylosporangium sp.]|nr:YndJ family protein [Dactylosporangium sp.]
MRLTDWAHVLLNALIGVGMLLVVPLGLDLVDGAWTARRRLAWLAAATAGAVSLWLPRGGPAVALAAAYLLAAGWLAAGIPARLWPPRRITPAGLAVCTALASPSIAASALVAERAGYRLFGFPLDVLGLTVAHFHYAGFTAALVAGLVCRLDPARRAGRLAALAVPAGTALVLAGFFAGDWVQVAGAAVLTAGMWITGWLTLREAAPAAAGRATRALLVTSALVLVATMLLALDWAVGRATGLPHLSASWMVATHGAANALGFALTAVLAWRTLAAQGPARAGDDGGRQDPARRHDEDGDRLVRAHRIPGALVPEVHQRHE